MKSTTSNGAIGTEKYKPPQFAVEKRVYQQKATEMLKDNRFKEFYEACEDGIQFSKSSICNGAKLNLYTRKAEEVENPLEVTRVLVTNIYPHYSEHAIKENVDNFISEGSILFILDDIEKNKTIGAGKSLYHKDQQITELCGLGINEPYRRSNIGKIIAKMRVMKGYEINAGHLVTKTRGKDGLTYLLECMEFRTPLSPEHGNVPENSRDMIIKLGYKVDKRLVWDRRIHKKYSLLPGNTDGLFGLESWEIPILIRECKKDYYDKIQQELIAFFEE